MKRMIVLMSILLGSGMFCPAQDTNLVPVKFRNFPSFNRGGRSATIKVTPGKSYLVRASVKLKQTSTNPSTKVRFVVTEKGKRGMKVFEWYTLNAETFTNMSVIYKASAGVTEATVILNPHFTVEERGVCKNFCINEVDEELDE